MNVCPDDIFRIADHYDTKLGIITQHHEPECHAEKKARCLQCQGHSKSLYLYDQNMTISTLSSKLLVCLQSNLVVQHHKPECSVQKLDYWVQARGQSKCSKCWWMFDQMISSEVQNIYLPNLVWWCSIMSHSVRWGKKLFAILKVTGRAHVIKIWFFLLYPLNCWFLGNQTWLDITSS